MFSLHPGPQDHALTNHRQSPLMGELLAVLLEQPFGVDAVPLERATPEVVDEQVMSHGQLETGPACSLCQVVVVEEPQPELLVEPADCLVDRPLHEQAEPGQLAPCTTNSENLVRCTRFYNRFCGKVLEPEETGQV